MTTAAGLFPRQPPTPNLFQLLQSKRGVFRQQWRTWIYTALDAQTYFNVGFGFFVRFVDRKNILTLSFIISYSQKWVPKKSKGFSEYYFRTT